MSNSWEKVKERYEIICNEIEESTGVKEGAHVHYIGIAENNVHLEHPQYCGSPSDPRGILDFDTVYEIECVMLARSFCNVKLVGYRNNKFNASVFEVINKNEKKKCLKAGGFVCYIAPKTDLLKYEAIYEVEKVLKNEAGLGFDCVKLVGFEEKFKREWFEKVEY